MLPPRFKEIAFLCLILAVNVVGFQNCGADFAVRDDLDLASYQAGMSCESQMKSQFEGTYASFLRTNCVGCHVPGGLGKGAFAQSNSTAAFNAFLMATSDRIDTMAVSSSHAAPFTGTQNQEAINAASASWNQALTACKSGTGDTTGDGIATIPKVMSATTTNKDITWALNTELASGTADLGGATLTVAVRMVTSGGYTTYFFNTPRLKAGTKPLHIESLMVVLNGQRQSLGTIWSLASADVAAGQTVTLSTSQMLLEYAAASTDTLAISIGVLEAR